MKIGIINFHYAYNYGAVLQCTALKRKLENMGNEVVVIDYRPSYQQQYYMEYPNPFSSAMWAYRKFKHQGLGCRLYHMFGRFVRVLLTYREAGKRRKLREGFEPFTESHLNLTKRYRTYRALKKDAPVCDVYICGSDQLWNPSVTWGLDPAYFLNFGSRNVKRIAYAVSPCSQLNVYEYAQELKRFGRVLNYVSLREAEKQIELEKLFGKNIDICLDPTLFLNEKEYADYETDISDIGTSYILVYAFADDDQNQSIFEVVKEVSHKLKLKVIDVSIDDLAWPYKVERRLGTSPGEFLTYIKKSAYVITNSVHGTVFSIVYHKNFLTVPKNRTSSRMSELLKSLGLSERLVVSSNRQKIPYDSLIDYTCVNKSLEKLCAHGQSYLENSLKT